MAWSYRQDNSDEIYAAGGGPTTIPGQPVPYVADGAISPSAGFALLTKGSAGAYTLAAPTAGSQTLVISNGTAFAHVVTATGLIQDGVTGGAKNTLTFGAFVGSSVELRASSGKWNVVSKNVVTIA